MTTVPNLSAELAAHQALEQLSGLLDGDVRIDRLHQMLYAQDASIYAEAPLGVAFPRSTKDVVEIVKTAEANGFALIPRAAGTSLAGQCVGEGLVVDVGRHMNRIIEVDADAKVAVVEPGVILDDLNAHLAPLGLMVGPDTSTANRCMIGGMVGNNSCGSHSIFYGTTRDHVLGLEVVFSDGSVHWIEDWSEEELASARKSKGRLGNAISTLDQICRDHAEQIKANYPRPGVVRRNTGYALDDIVYRAEQGEPFSLQRFLCGSEGTLGFTTKIRLNLVDRPAAKIVVCAHFDDLLEALRATVIAVSHNPSAVELIDRRILDQTKNNLEQQRNRFFVDGDPAGVLVIEFYGASVEEVEAGASGVIASLTEAGLGYAYPIVRPPDDKRVWSLRKAGLGLLMGIPGDRKAVSVVEDTAVPVDVLPEYIADFMEMMDRYGTDSVYHAHASVGELHLRPELDLKSPADVELMGKIAQESAELVKKYRGSLSGEHGDGRVRAPYIEAFYGPEVYELLVQVKRAFDPQNIFNPSKIVDAEPIDADLRAEPGAEPPEIATLFDWSVDGGLLQAVEKCNGAGACRKKVVSGGTMCPSYMVTLEEKDTTRGRANVFRHLLLEGPAGALRSEELHEALDLCLSCKGCKSECPANVDMARMKAEFLQHYHDHNGTPLSAKLFGHYGKLSRLASIAPWLANFFMTFALTRWLMGRFLGLAPQRQMPAYAKKTFTKLWAKHAPATHERTVWLYVDPFTEYTEPELGMAAVKVLEAAGVTVERFGITDDARTYLSKGLVREAREVMVSQLTSVKSALEEHPQRPVLGIEPSALLTFRDEMPDLVEPWLRETARDLAKRSFLVDEWLDAEMQAARIESPFRGSGNVILHGHCHQKAIVGVQPTERLLRTAGYSVKTLPSGCCGMAGSFGYEEKHYELSMQVGELVLFPSLREAPEDAIVVAPGTSCRHQIADGVDRTAIHPLVALERAL